MAAAVTMFGDLTASDYRAGLALAEAIVPGSKTVPAADETTFERACDAVRDLHPALVQAWRLAIRAVDAAAVAYTGRPFHALDARKQGELVTRWQTDPVLKTPLNAIALAVKFVHFDRDDVYESFGGKLNVVSNLEQPRWLEQVHRASEWTEGDLECDVVVVGTGAGGGVVGRELAERGLAVVYLEEGEHHRRDAFDGRSVSAHRRFYRGAFTVGNAPMPIFMGRLVGGSTAINGGTCFRTPPSVLERWAEELGTDELGPAGMRPYFEKVERYLEVAPSPREIIGPIADFVARGCDALGWSHTALMRNAPGCDGKGFCDFGCRTDARRGTNLSYVPAALGRGALLLTGACVERVLVENGTRAVGVEASAGPGKTVRVRAKAVVLAGGSIPTPLLMLKQGLAETGGQVGRNLSLHPSTGYAAVAEELIRGPSHIPQGYGCDEFQSEGFMMLAAQPDYNVGGLIFPLSGQRLMEALDQLEHMASFGLLIRDQTPNGRVWRDVGGLPAVTYNFGPEDVRRVHDCTVRMAEMSFAAGARRVYPFVLGHPPIDTRADLDAFRRERLKPADFIWTSYHPLGTARMSRDPSTGVVDRDHAVHGYEGLYVVDGSSVRGPLGVNPQLTIMALATRAAEKIAARV
jgi:choline dehydrogenase-like flavoprotein